MRFEWDSAKDALNRVKHGITFEEASALFTSGVKWLEIDDDAHGGDEVRHRAIGPIRPGVAVVVCTDRDEDVVRIVSARLATRRETRMYEVWIEEHL